MSSRSIVLLVAFAFVVALGPAPAARAAATPADSTAAATPASDEPAASAPADSVKDATKEAQEQVKDAKDEAKESIKEEAKKEEEKADAKKAEAKKSAKKTKAEAKKSAKGTVKSVEAGAKGTMPVKPATAPQRVQVQHILIGFSGSVPGKVISRSKDEAKTLAYELLERARKGESFDELVAKYTDDSPPGIYGMCEKGLQPAAGEYPRDGMVAAFGNVGFNISPGNIGIADYDPASSPFGYHIIKRLK